MNTITLELSPLEAQEILYEHHITSDIIERMRKAIAEVINGASSGQCSLFSDTHNEE